MSPWIKERGRSLLDNAAYEGVRLLILALVLPVFYAGWRFITRQPLQWVVLLLFIALGLVALGLLTIAHFRKNAPPEPQLKTNPEIQLESEGGLISARITNHSDSEVRIEDLWIASLDATGKKTEAKTIRKGKFRRCEGMPHVMAARSSFEVTFRYSEGAFQSYAQSHPHRAQTEYWIEVKLEDGTVIPSDHRQITIGSTQPTAPTSDNDLDRRDRIMLAVSDAVNEGKKFFWALLDARADEISDNDDLIYICETLMLEGHKNELDSIPKIHWLEVLKKARLSPKRPRNEIELYGFILELANLRRNLTEGAKCNPLQIEALQASPKTDNKTQLDWATEGKPTFHGDCILSIHNPNLTQGITGIGFRLLSIKPVLVSARGFDPTTEDQTLRCIKFPIDDIRDNILRGDQKGHVRIFTATRKPFAEPQTLKNITVRFGGEWPIESRKEFTPKSEHILTVEASGDGLQTTVTQFKVSFSPKREEPVFTLTKLAS